MTSGLAIYDTMQYVRCPVIDDLPRAGGVDGARCSSRPGTKGRRYALPNARIMIHQPLGGARGQATDIEIQAREIRHLKDVLTDILVERDRQEPRGASHKDIDRDFYLGGAQAKEYGLIDDDASRRKKKAT